VCVVCGYGGGCGSGCFCACGVCLGVDEGVIVVVGVFGFGYISLPPLIGQSASVVIVEVVFFKFVAVPVVVVIVVVVVVFVVVVVVVVFVLLLLLLLLLLLPLGVVVVAAAAAAVIGFVIAVVGVDPFFFMEDQYSSTKNKNRTCFSSKLVFVSSLFLPHITQKGKIPKKKI